jgi:hypothetical protein
MGGACVFSQASNDPANATFAAARSASCRVSTFIDGLPECDGHDIRRIRKNQVKISIGAGNPYQTVTAG